MKKLVCPSCGGSFQIEDASKRFVYCMHCGTQIQLDDIVITERIINEAEIKKAEVIHDLELERIKTRARETKTRFIQVLIPVICSSASALIPRDICIIIKEIIHVRIIRHSVRTARTAMEENNDRIVHVSSHHPDKLLLTVQFNISILKNRIGSAGICLVNL